MVERDVAPSTTKQAGVVLVRFEAFVTSKCGAIPPSFSIDEIIGYMLFRVAGAGDDAGEGALKLNMFLSKELFCLVRGCTQKYGKMRFPFDMRKIRKDPGFSNAVNIAKRRYGGVNDEVSARPIWYEDEKRLLSATSSCTRGYHDRALLVLLIHTGARAHDACAILYEDLKWRRLSVGESFYEIPIPNQKASNNRPAYARVSGDAAVHIKEWLVRRREICQHSGYLFLRTNGHPLMSQDVCEMMDGLSRFAGYGAQFFTGHSGRMSFACRAAAEVFSQGGQSEDVYDRVCSTGLWSFRSSAVRRYCDMNVRHFFIGEGRIPWDAFRSLTPNDMHGLRDILNIERKPNVWFCHGFERLIELGEIRD
jgi:hypothetical protein